MRSLSVIIPLWNELELTRACVDTLARGRSAHGLPHELLLVNNGSTDGTAAWCDELAAREPWVRVVHLPENRGFAAGCNAGLRAARGDLVAFLNNDTLVPAALWKRMTAAWLRSPRVGLVAPTSNYVKGRQLLELFGDEDAEDHESIQRRLDTDCAHRVEDCVHLAGLCLLGERSLLEELEGFDERFGLGNYEDDDLCLRVRLRNLRLLIARDAYVFHLGNRTFRALGIDYESQLREMQAAFADKWKDEVLWRAEEDLNAGVPDSANALECEGAVPGIAFRLRARARGAEQVQAFLDAERFWTDYLRYCPGDSEAHCHAALCRIRAGDQRGGRRALAAVFAEHCFDSLAAASAMTQLARYERDAGRHASARQDVEDALLVRPGFRPALHLLSILMLDAGEYEEALELLAPHMHEDDPCTLTNYGIALHHVGRSAEACEVFARGARLEERPGPCAENLAQLLRLQRPLAAAQADTQ